VGRLPAAIEIGPGVSIPAAEIRLSYARSSGPGGQHVNRTSSKVLLRWNVRESRALDDERRARLLQRLASRLTVEGEILIASERHRDQGRNVEDAVARLVDIVRGGLRRPKARKATRPTRASRERRLESKRRRGATKRDRREPG